MPQTPAVRKRRFVVSFHVDENELSFLNRQVAASSLNREEYLRTLIVGKEIHPRPCTHHADLLRKVAGLCNNANQLAHRANSTGTAGQGSVDEMTRLTQAGVFRTRSVGVVDQKGNILHFGTLPDYVPDSVMKLLDWAEHSTVHMLIRSCVFHYEFEIIHPFADCNGRMGRLWHTLMLSKWNPVLAWLPVESVIHDHQQEYYDAINACNYAGESTVFVEFMLASIKASLMDVLSVSDGMSDAPVKPDKEVSRWNLIKAYLNDHSFIMNADVRALCGVSAATANRILAGLVRDGKLEKCRENSWWVYKRKAD